MGTRAERVLARARKSERANEHRTPGQFGVAQENDFDSLFPSECGVRGCDGSARPSLGRRRKVSQPRITREETTLPKTNGGFNWPHRSANWKSCQASRKTSSARSASRLHNARVRVNKRPILLSDLAYFAYSSQRDSAVSLFPFYFLYFPPIVTRPYQ